MSTLWVGLIPRRSPRWVLRTVNHLSAQTASDHFRPDFSDEQLSAARAVLTQYMAENSTLFVALKMAGKTPAGLSAPLGLIAYRDGSEDARPRP